MESATKPRISEKVINKLVKNHFGNSTDVIKIKELTDGFFNTAYEIVLSSKLMTLLKVSPSSNVRTLRYEKNIMKAEVNAMEVISKCTNIPIPEIFFYNPNKDIIDNEYFFMQYIDDLPFDKVLPEISQEQFKKVNVQLGEYTREIHNIEGNKFGYILSGQTGYEKWSDAFASFVDNLLQDAIDENVKLDIDFEECRQLVIEKKGALDSVKDPHFLHGDLWWGNVFVDPKKLEITAITDWERTLFGDILFEFVFGFIEDIESFNIGYGTKKGIPRMISV